MCPGVASTSPWSFEIRHYNSDDLLRQSEDGQRDVRAVTGTYLRKVNIRDVSEESWSSLFVVADEPIGDSCHFPDSGEWLVRSPKRRLIRSNSPEYYDGEE